MSSAHFKTITRRIHPTKTLTNFRTLTSTTLATVTVTPSPLAPLKEWEHQLIYMPLLLVFAAIGILSIAGILIYLTFRFCRANKKKSPPSDREDIEKGNEFVPYDLPWISNTIHETKEADISGISRHLRPAISPPNANNLPIHTSLKLVPRWVIMNDPERRHGVDEIALWEKNQSTKAKIVSPASPWKLPLTRTLPDSPESVKRESTSPASTLSVEGEAQFIQPNQNELEINTQHELLANDKQDLSSTIKDTRPENSLEEGKSNQWLQFTGSKSF